MGFFKRIAELTWRINYLTGLPVDVGKTLGREAELIRGSYMRGDVAEAMLRANKLAGWLDELEDGQRHQQLRSSPLTHKAWARAEKAEVQADFLLAGLCWYFECGSQYPEVWATFVKAREMIKMAMERLVGLELGTAETLLDQAEALLQQAELPPEQAEAASHSLSANLNV